VQDAQTKLAGKRQQNKGQRCNRNPKQQKKIKYRQRKAPDSRSTCNHIAENNRTQKN